MTNEEKILSLLGEMRTDIGQMKTGMNQMQTDISQMQTGMDQMRADINQMRTDMNQMQATLTKVAITQENVVLPQLKLLAEGHETLLETLAPKNRVEKLEEDMELLKTAIRALSREVAELKKAQ